MIEIGLGTVQMGLVYGNQPHRMSLKEAKNIFDHAKSHGIAFFDTSPDYGEAEARLGKWNSQVEISTKIPHAPEVTWKSKYQYRKWVWQWIHRSCKQLKISHFQLLQFHQSNLKFLNTPHVRLLMEELLASGICKQIGVSVYEPAEAQAALCISFVKSIQFPINLLDQRFVPLLTKHKNVKWIGRSIFLQGVLIPSCPLPSCLCENELNMLRKWCNAIAMENGFSLLELCLFYIFSNLKNDLSLALMGVDSLLHFKTNLSILNKKRFVPQKILEKFKPIQDFALEKNLLVPMSWKQVRNFSKKTKSRDTVAFVQARLTSSRLPNKVLKNLGLFQSIELLYFRLLRSRSLDSVVFVIPDNRSNDLLAQYITHTLRAPLARGSENDVLSRFRKAAISIPAKYYVRLTADCPFISPEIIDRVVKLCHDNHTDYSSNLDPPTFADGFDVECFNARTLRYMHKYTKGKDREHVTLGIRKNFPTKFRRKHLNQNPSKAWIRLTLDTTEDLRKLQNIANRLGSHAIDCSSRELERMDETIFSQSQKNVLPVPPNQGGTKNHGI